MTDLRDMELLCALDQHRHFARAANACGISQPAFSARIRNLETDLGTAIVHRGNRFQGFTDEGLIVLQWARRLLDDADALEQALSDARGHLTGELIIGSIPTALPFAADIPAMIRRRHPALRVQLRSASAKEIRQGIESRALHAGITYAEDDNGAGTVCRPLYDEHYILLVPEGAAAWPEDLLPWADAARLPLCLLTEDMQNRRIVNEIFRSIGVQPVPVTSTNAFTVALAQLVAGGAATIAPALLVEKTNLPPTIRQYRLIDPIVATPIEMVRLQRDPVPAAIQALEEVLDSSHDNQS